MSIITKPELIRFEDRIRAHWQAGNLPCLLHLCGGNEDALIRILGSEFVPGDWVLSGHRNHYHALMAGISAEDLEREILAGRSMFTFSKEHNFMSSAILAGMCSIANGIAWALKEDAGEVMPELAVWCFLGDGAEEEGHFYEAALFAEVNDLPVAFVVEDNDRQVDTPKAERGAGSRPTLDQIFRCVTRYSYQPTYPHAGDGSAPGTIQFNQAAIADLQFINRD